MKRSDADQTIRSSTYTLPVAVDGHRVGVRETSLLLIAAGFALLMMDLGNLALIAGCAVVALWVYASIRGPRPGPVLTLAYGAGLFVTCFWWPREGWWPVAIGLTWIGITLMSIGVVSLLVGRIRRG